MDKDIINWLLEDPIWLKHAVQLQLLNVKPDIQLTLQDSQIMKVINRLKDNDVGLPALKKGNVQYTSSGNAYWDLFFLADIGLTINDLQLNEEVEEIFKLQLPDGTFVTQLGVKPNYFCIPAIILSSLVKIGYKEDLRIKKYIQIILNSQRLDGGWHCAKNRSVGQKLQDTESCPMDNLNILLLLGQYEEYRRDIRFNGAIDLLLIHWSRRDEKWRPYGFGIGSDFVSLKYPAVKYGILRVLDVLSLFPYAIENKAFKEMLDFVKQKSIIGKYTPESISKSYIDFDFGQKKEPSKWITFLISRIEKRVSDFSNP